MRVTPPNYEFLQTVKPQGTHGEGFTYRTANTDALGWILARVTGKSVAQLLSERIWAPMGAEQDAYLSVDSIGTPFAGGGLHTGLRDLARFGEMIRNNGAFNGRQIVRAIVVGDAQRARRLRRPRRARADGLHRPEGGSGDRALRLASGGGQCAHRPDLAARLPDGNLSHGRQGPRQGW